MHAATQIILHIHKMGGLTGHSLMLHHQMVKKTLHIITATVLFIWPGILTIFSNQ
jgi:hypothetical protein